MSELVLTPTTLPTGVAGLFYSVQFAASGGTPPYLWTCNSPPPGISMSSAGLLSGTLMGSTQQTILVTATDNGAPQLTANAYLLLATAPALLIDPILINIGRTQWSAQLSASGGVPPYTWSSLDCPYSLTSDGTLSAYSVTLSHFSIKVVDSKGSTTSMAYLSWEYPVPWNGGYIRSE